MMDLQKESRSMKLTDNRQTDGLKLYIRNNRQAEQKKKMSRLMQGQTDIQTDRQTDRQIDRQTDG